MRTFLLLLLLLSLLLALLGIARDVAATPATLSPTMAGAPVPTPGNVVTVEIVVYSFVGVICVVGFALFVNACQKMRE